MTEQNNRPAIAHVMGIHGRLQRHIDHIHAVLDSNFASGPVYRFHYVQGKPLLPIQAFPSYVWLNQTPDVVLDHSRNILIFTWDGPIEVPSFAALGFSIETIVDMSKGLKTTCQETSYTSPIELMLKDATVRRQKESPMFMTFSNKDDFLTLKIEELDQDQLLQFFADCPLYKTTFTKPENSTMTNKAPTQHATGRVAIPGLFAGQTTFTKVDTLVIPPHIGFDAKSEVYAGIATELSAIHAKAIADYRYLFIAASVGLTTAGFLLTQLDETPAFLIEFIDEQDEVIHPDQYQAYLETEQFMAALRQFDADPKSRFVLVFDVHGVVQHVAAYRPEEILRLSLPKLGIDQPTEPVKEAPKVEPRPPVPPYSKSPRTPYHRLCLKAGIELLSKYASQVSSLGGTPKMIDAYTQQLMSHFGGSVSVHLGSIYRSIGTSAIKLGRTERHGAFAEVLLLAGMEDKVVDLFAIYANPGAVITYQEALERRFLREEDVERVESLKRLDLRSNALLIRFNSNFEILRIDVVKEGYDFVDSIDENKDAPLSPPWSGPGFDPTWLNPGKLNAFEVGGHPPRGAMFNHLPQPNPAPAVPGGWPMKDSRAKFRDLFDTVIKFGHDASDKDKDAMFEELLKAFRPDVVDQGQATPNPLPIEELKDLFNKMESCSGESPTIPSFYRTEEELWTKLLQIVEGAFDMTIDRNDEAALLPLRHLFEASTRSQVKNHTHAFEQFLNRLTQDAATVKTVIQSADPFRAFFNKLALAARAPTYTSRVGDELFGELCQLLLAHHGIDPNMIPGETYMNLRSVFGSAAHLLRTGRLDAGSYDAFFAKLMAAIR